MEKLHERLSDDKIKATLAMEVAADIDGSALHFKFNMLPCLTAARGSASGYWLAARKRRTHVHELMRAQGMHPDKIPMAVATSASTKPIF